MQIGSISGGTDILSCFVLNNPLDEVISGEIQCRGLGMAVDVFDEEGNSVTDTPGELVCTKPFPSMPLSFWGDKDDKKYFESYFNKFPDVNKKLGPEMKSTGESILFIDDLNDDEFFELYSRRKMYLTN